jgi:hypothetical protein
MAVASTATWNPYLVQIVHDALVNSTAVAADDEIAYTLYVSALSTLNGIVKSAEAMGLHVWTEEQAVLFLQPGVNRYIIGGTAPTAHATDAEDWILVTLTADALAGATTIEADEAPLLANGMQIGVVLDSGLIQWTTVSGAPVGTTITLAAALDGDATSGNFAYAYTTDIIRPLKIPNSRLMTITSSGLLETPMTILSRQEYMDLPNKFAQGTTTQWFFSPQRDVGLFYPWPLVTVGTYAASFTWYRPIADLLVPTNTVDFPQEWVHPLTWRLAQELAVGLGVPELTWNRLTAMSQGYTDLVESYDRESEPVQFGMDYQYQTER